MLPLRSTPLHSTSGNTAPRRSGLLLAALLQIEPLMLQPNLNRASTS
jgi:hypothetical protein